MADSKTRALKPSILAADRDSLAALKNITDYAPSNPAYTTKALEDLLAASDDKAAGAAAAEAEAKAKRDDAVAAAWAYHDAVVGMRDAVGVQYGKSSNNFQSVGRKKTTEYKKRSSKSSKSNSQQ